jgi:hypothetical protein
MNGKLTLSFSVATFIAAVGLMFFLADVRDRLDRVEKEVAAQGAPAEAPRTRGAVPPAGDEGAESGEREGNILDSKDPLEKLDWLIEKAEESDTDAYDFYSDLSQEQYKIKRALAQLKTTVMRILQGLRDSGDFPGLAPDLPAHRAPLTAENLQKYKEDAEKFGIRVEEGKVTARGILNGRQDRAYPIEYFMTRFPDAGHETLVHLMGTATVEDFKDPPYPSLEGLATALYKALLAAGFEEGEGSHPDPDSPDPRAPQWVLATGDTVYLYVRYEEDGETKLARATDWVIDPATGSPLPHDCFKFTGSLRIEHPDTGEEVLLAEPRGFLVSVFPDRAAMVEVALKTAVNNNYQYNWPRLPKHDMATPLYVDLIFSRTPLEK